MILKLAKDEEEDMLRYVPSPRTPTLLRLWCMLHPFHVNALGTADAEETNATALRLAMKIANWKAKLWEMSGKADIELLRGALG